MILDTHHHFWKIQRGDYHWLTPEIPQVLYQDYMPEDLRPILKEVGISKTIVVQAAETVEETNFLLGLASKNDFIAGVTGWIDMESPDFPERLKELRKNPYFVAIRPMIQDKSDDRWILRPKVFENLSHLSDLGFPFEILVYPKQIPSIIEAVEKLPGLKAVINHMAKPHIKGHAMEPWATQMSQLAKYPNIYCKLSGIVTEADHEHWTIEDISPYVEHIVKVFGSTRLMFGSDWPVSLLAAPYVRVIEVLRTILTPLLTQNQIHKIFYTNGMEFYGLTES